MSVVTPPDDAAVDVADESQQSVIKRITSLQSVWILGVLLVIVAFFTVTAGGKFFSTSNFSLISQNIAVWAVLGVGMTFVIITSGIDLSVGSVLVFSSVVAAKVMEGIGGDKIPTTVHFDVVDEWRQVSDRDAMAMTRRLAREEGILVGGSAGLNVHIALEIAREIDDPNAMIVTLPAAACGGGSAASARARGH